ncbi:MAG: penicillin-binding protein 2 [Bacillati bacterium ANGP1]|uniref:Penicillin-binding protein 2 n=1 Tax=Candidatus Segetimicrobium genomatis TaxID=2569760 RepID=A0A537LEN1_9BACT|nr:MAG: penicillin-binding protein 2 [Terrabacteria group bacterium ANGP1]
MENQQPSRRLFILSLIIGMLIGILVVRLWQVQVLQGASYLRQSEDNRIRDYTLAAPRGIIYDRKGRPLVSNRPAFTVAVLPLELRNPAIVIPRLAPILAMAPDEITTRIVSNRPRLFEPVRIKRDVGPNVVAMIEENRLDLPGVIILPEPVRYYLHGKMAAHVLGYLGEVDPDELAARQVEGYKPGDLIGKAGAERAYETVLRGIDGRLRMEVDALGRPLRVLSRLPAIPGRAIVLTLDLDVQKAAYDALVASGMQAGAAMAMDPRSGDILAMASIPSYDPNLFAIGISPKAWQAITTDRRKPLLNRAIAATYEPGSVFKLVTATAALEHGIVTRQTMFDAPGYFQLGQWTFGDLRAWGRIDFITGIANSVNVVFYTLGYRLGGEELAKYALMMGLGELTGVDLPGEINGTIPSPSTKEQLVGEPWYPGDSVNMSIGQGAITVTPIQVVRMLGGIATGGQLMQPRILLMTYDRNRSQHRADPFLQRTVPFQASTLAVLREGMRAVVERGSGLGARIPGLPMAGKTGSAENPRGKPHAWFAGYAPVGEPRIVVVAFVEHGFRGGISAAPVARAVLHAVFPQPADVEVPR